MAVVAGCSRSGWRVAAAVLAAARGKGCRDLLLSIRNPHRGWCVQIQAFRGASWSWTRACAGPQQNVSVCNRLSLVINQW